jgi:hypothetical protein
VKQVQTLNTNSRYLHPEIVRYAARLAAKFAPPLRVVYWVNSGSEANDLALRLSRAHTGRRGVIAVRRGDVERRRRRRRRANAARDEQRRDSRRETCGHIVDEKSS